jgi:hypothetical protein
MAIHNELPIYRAALDLTCLSSRLVAHMPRNHRAVDGARLVGCSRELLEHIRRANQAVDKVPHLARLIEKIDDVSVELRICLELRLISQQAYANTVFLATSVGKQAGGWKKKSASTPVSRPPRQP